MELSVLQWNFNQLLTSSEECFRAEKSKAYYRNERAVGRVETDGGARLQAMVGYGRGDNGTSSILRGEMKRRRRRFRCLSPRLAGGRPTALDGAVAQPLAGGDDFIFFDWN
jgi:hypothetical protein